MAHFAPDRILATVPLFVLRVDEYLDGSRIVLIEWSENAADILPETYKTVHISYGNSENDRTVAFGEVSD